MELKEKLKHGFGGALVGLFLSWLLFGWLFK